MKKLLIFDTNAIMHLVFHGYKKSPSYNAQGFPTYMLRGFIHYTNTAIATHNPDYTVFVFDPDGKTFRHDIYPEYKATRPPKDPEFKSQELFIKEYLKLLGYPVYTISGFEGDDVVATIATRASKHTIFEDIIIYTGDKDIYQILDDKISIFNLKTKSLVTPHNILDSFPVRHTSVVDYLTLLGDSVDNVKGVNQCGEKTALKLIERFDSIDNIYNSLNNINFKDLNISAKIGNAIVKDFEDNYERIMLSKHLITLRCDIDFPLSTKSLLRIDCDMDNMNKFLLSQSLNIRIN